MTWGRAALALLAVVVLALLAVSGDEAADPETPPALPGLPPPFLGTAVVGDGGMTGAVDAYGDIVDLRAPGPGGRALIDNPSDRQAAGTVPTSTGIVPRVRIGAGPAQALWEADSVRQRYLYGTNVVQTVARFGQVTATVRAAAQGQALALVADVEAPPGVEASPQLSTDLAADCVRERRPERLGLVCGPGPKPPAAAVLRAATAGDRRWSDRARPLGPGASGRFDRLYLRSLLTLHALTDRESGAVVAGARDGWAYVWPRDAATAALAYAAAGYDEEAERVVRFLLGVGLDSAARFHGDGSPVAGRAAQGDATGWVAAAAQGAGLIGGAEQAARILSQAYPVPWRGLADYQEGEAGDFLGNAIASGAPLDEFRARSGLVRRAGDPASGLDSAAAWAVRPFPRPAQFDAVRRTLERLHADGTAYGITPGEGWHGGEDPWSAPTAWSAWSLAALGDRAGALDLLADLHRAATPAGSLPERVDLRTGVPTSTTPLAWSHAFTVLALRELWP